MKINSEHCTGSMQPKQIFKIFICSFWCNPVLDNLFQRSLNPCAIFFEENDELSNSNASNTFPAFPVSRQPGRSPLQHPCIQISKLPTEKVALFDLKDVHLRFLTALRSCYLHSKGYYFVTSHPANRLIAHVWTLAKKCLLISPKQEEALNRIKNTVALASRNPFGVQRRSQAKFF